MRKKRLLLFAIMCTVLLLKSPDSCAENLVKEAAEIYGINDLDEILDEETRKISGNLGDDGIYDAESALKRLADKLIDDASEVFQNNIENVASLLAIALLSSAICCFVSDKSSQKYISIAGVCAAAYTLTGGIDGLVTQTTEALIRMADYSRAAIPAVFTAAVSSGAVVSASAKYAAVTIAIDMLMSMSRNLLVPLIYAYLALALSSAVFENAILKACQRAVKWIAGTLLTGFTIIFGAFMGISGLVSGAADALAVKTARTVISTTLPVVGGIISDAASTVLSAAAMIRNSAGALSLIAVCALCAGPFVMLSIKMLLFKATAAACEMLPNSRMSVFINDVGTALSMLLGLLGCCAIMLFISFMAAIKVVTV